MSELSEPHSAAYMGPQRDLFWNPDHVELLGRRFQLARAKSVLDVGSGQGHWGRLIDRVTAPDATTVGVDFEPAWVAEATLQARAAGLGDRFRYQQGSAESLPFADASFDLVTCQTLLIHVRDPSAVIAEMVRVTKPGGLVLAAEPNNRAGVLVETFPSPDSSPETLVRRLAFYLICEHGKIVLGEGDNSVGDRVPGYFAAAGLQAVQTFMSDKTWPLTPPYDGDEQQSIARLLAKDADSGTWLGRSRDDSWRLYRAGGGTATDFDRCWEERMQEAKAVAAAIETRQLHTAGGVIHYIVGGWRTYA